MTKKIEIDILLFMLIEALFLLFFIKENILTIILGCILGIVLTFIFKNFKPNKIIKNVLIIISFPFSLITLYHIINFINFNILRNYSIYPIIFSFLLISIYLIFKDYHTFIKTSEIIFYFFLFFKIISFILIIFQIDFNNIIMIKKNISYQFITIGLSILYLSLSLKYLTNYQFNNRLSIMLINPIIIKILIVLVLGNTLTMLYKYPYVNYLKTIRYFDFIERIDGLLAYEYLFAFFFLFTFILFNIKVLIKKTDKSV